jgi:hypothetical protein
VCRLAGRRGFFGSAFVDMEESVAYSIVCKVCKLGVVRGSHGSLVQAG